MKFALLFILLLVVLLMVTTISNNQVEASCAGSFDPDPQYEFYKTSTCKQRRGNLVKVIPNEEDQIDLDRKCISVANVAKRANFTFPWQADVWVRWHCPLFTACGGSTQGGIDVYRGRRCQGKMKFIRLGGSGARPYCIDRPGGGYVILRCLEQNF